MSPMSLTPVTSGPRDWRLVLLSASLGAAIAGLSLYFCLIRPRKRKSVTNTSEVDSKNRKVEIEKKIQENNQRKSSKMSMMLRDVSDAIDDAKIELRESIQETIDSLSSDIEGKVEVLKTVIKDSVMSPDMQEAVDTIQYVLERLKDFDKEAKKYDGFGFMLMALVKKAQLKIKEEESSPCQSPEVPLPLTRERLDYVKRCGHYAVRMYPVSWYRSNEAIAEDLGISADSILMVHFTDEEDEDHCPKFLLFLDHEIKTIVLAIRGTFCFKDAIMDVVCADEPFLEGKAHKGILSGADIILDKVKDAIIEAARDHPDYSLTVTGHSLGAGAAELITMKLISEPDTIPDIKNVRCVALAPPPVYQSDKSLPYEIVEAIDIFVNNFDCVPRLSLASVARLLAMVRAVDELGLTVGEQLKVLTEREEAADIMENVKTAVIEAKQDQFPLLEHPGTVFHIMKSSDEEDLNDDGEKQLIYLSKSRIFTESILLLENMIDDHLHGSYEKVLKVV